MYSLYCHLPTSKSQHSKHQKSCATWTISAKSKITKDSGTFARSVWGTSLKCWSLNVAKITSACYASQTSWLTSARLASWWGARTGAQIRVTINHYWRLKCVTWTRTNQWGITKTRKMRLLFCLEVRGTTVTVTSWCMAIRICTRPKASAENMPACASRLHKRQGPTPHSSISHRLLKVSLHRRITTIRSKGLTSDRSYHKT